MSALPTWEGFMLPVLTVLSDGHARTTREIRRDTYDLVDLSEEDRTGMLPSGRSTRAADRVSWALHFMKRVGALARPRRATYVITDVGRELLAMHPAGLTEQHLKPLATPGDEWWTNRSGSGGPSASKSADPTAQSVSDADTTGGQAELLMPVIDPYEQVEEGIRRIEDEIASELLSRLTANDPAFFEDAVVELLLAMGYGGVGGRGVVTAAQNDGGIDGVIDQDVLGLNKVYVQAKRYAAVNTVGRPEVQGFVGALAGKADGGVFITTSRFTREAMNWAAEVPPRIILIDGDRLAELMIEYGVGVQVERTYRLVQVDEDFFT